MSQKTKAQGPVRSPGVTSSGLGKSAADRAASLCHVHTHRQALGTYWLTLLLPLCPLNTSWTRPHWGQVVALLCQTAWQTPC